MEIGRAPLMLTIGELLDRASIIKLKIEHLQDGDKFKPELKEILEAIQQALPKDPDQLLTVIEGAMNLILTNHQIWMLEDDLRNERSDAVAKRVAAKNDLRSAYKRKVDNSMDIGTGTSEKFYVSKEEK